MQVKTKFYWVSVMAAFFITAFIGSCKKDKNLEIEGVCPVVIATNPTNLATGVPLDQVITVTFNEKMDPSTINAASFTITGSTVAGTVSYDGVTATFTPASPLIPNHTYTGRVTTAAKDLMGLTLQTDYVWTFSTGANIVPTVISTDPDSNETGVFLNKIIAADFSMIMDPLTINSTTFTLKQGATLISGTYTYSGITALFTPTNPLTSNTIYDVTITTGATNAAGTPLAANYTWKFTTGTILAPTVISTDPTNNATAVPLNKIITATFSMPMDPLTITGSTFTLKQGSTVIAGTVTYSGSTATFTPASSLIEGTTYTGTITTGARNPAGISLSNNYFWNFTTAFVTAPIVISTDPISNATGVPLNKTVTATFNMNMDPLTLNAATFTLKQGVTTIVGTITLSGQIASFKPNANLLPGLLYTATITTGAKNPGGLALATNYVWSFTTGTTIAPTVVSTDPSNLASGVVLNKKITATFSMPMDPATINASTFILMQGTTAVTGTVTYNGLIASFKPTLNLIPGTVYTATVTSGAKNVAGVALANNYTWSFITAASAAPLVISTDPTANAINVPLNKVIRATFNMNMDPATINSTTFTVMQGTTPVTGVVTYNGTIASFTPTLNLVQGKTYTATITTGAKNTGGVALANAFVWNFNTIVTTPPSVTSTDPASNATGVALNKVVTATFNMNMDPTTINGTTFTVKEGTNTVTGTVSYLGTTATFTPTSNFVAGKVYTATITTGAKNVSGVALASDYVWSFTTLTPPPTVISTDPTNGATLVALNKVISATFSEPMDQLTISSLTFTLKIGVTPISGAVTYSGSTAYFTPTSNLLSDNVYTATITTGAKNVAGVALVSNYVWTFSTKLHLGPAMVDLKTVGRFGIIAGTAVSNNAGFSVINNMDVGIHPGARSSVTGFPPATVVNGAIYCSDDLVPAGVAAMLVQAKQDLTDAYLFAEGATAPAPVTVSGDQGGLTLAPGIYKSTSTLSVQNGDLTLDAQGDANAVWIFQIASTFTTVGGAGGNIILSGGAQAKNIFWQVGSSATIGSYTSFKGNVLALTSITMGAYSTATGRMLARNAAVTMTSTNIINKP